MVLKRIKKILPFGIYLLASACGNPSVGSSVKKLSDCSDGQAPCRAAVFGNNISAFTHPPGSTAVEAIIPDGFYYNKKALLSDPTFIAANIADGVTVFGLTGTATGIPAGCSSAGAQLVNCTAGAGSFWASNANSDFSGPNAAKTFLIPSGYYDGTTYAVANDTNLLSGNIINGVSILGVTGNATPAFSACSDDALNASQCTTPSGRFVTASQGLNLTTWSNSAASTTIVGTLPTGFYQGRSCSFSDVNLTSNKIVSGNTIFGVSGSATVAYPACTDDALNATLCSAGTNRYVTSAAGLNTTAWTNPSGTTTVTAALPTGFYAGRSCSFTDADLVGSKIVAGNSIFGVIGSAVAAHAACTDDSLNSSLCTAAANRFVTASSGADITNWANGSAADTITASIPNGFYSARSVSFSDPSLVPAKILSGNTIFGVTGTATAAFASCADEALNSARCSTGTGRYVSSVAGTNVTGWSNGSGTSTVSGTIPNGFYSGRFCSFSDTGLLPANIISGSSIFGVTGTATAAYASCTDNNLNSAQCSTAASRYVSATLGGTVNLSGSLTTTIPSGFYNGSTSCQISDAALMASNIRNGATILGISGTVRPSQIQAYRTPGTTPIDSQMEATTYAGTNLPAGYREIPIIGRTNGAVAVGDDEGIATPAAISGGYASVTKVARPSADCGISQATLIQRIADCNYAWVGENSGRLGWKTWRLVTRVTVGGQVGEVWRDEFTGLLWSSRVTINPINWCKAAGSNNISGNPAAENDAVGSCTNATYQNVSGRAISACYEDGNVNFTMTDADISPEGKAGLGWASSPKVRWRLPTINDFKQADLDGIRFVLPGMSSGASDLAWSASVQGNARAGAMRFQTDNALVTIAARDNSAHVWCIGR